MTRQIREEDETSRPSQGSQGEEQGEGADHEAGEGTREEGHEVEEGGDCCCEVRLEEDLLRGFSMGTPSYTKEPRRDRMQGTQRAWLGNS